MANARTTRGNPPGSPASAAARPEAPRPTATRPAASRPPAARPAVARPAGQPAAETRSTSAPPVSAPPAARASQSPPAPDTPTAPATSATPRPPARSRVASPPPVAPPGDAGPAEAPLARPGAPARRGPRAAARAPLKAPAPPAREETAPTGQEAPASGAGPRYCGFFLPGFPAWALARLHPELAGQPFVVVQGGKMTALSPEACALGVEPQWSLERMRALHPQVLVRPRHPAQEAVVWEQVLAALARLSPFVESLRPGLALLDLPQPAVLEPLLRALGARGGAACDRATAELAAYSAEPGTLRVVPATERAHFARRFPLEALGEVGISAETRERLGWFGWYCVADLRGLTRAQLEAQFTEGALLHHYAQGADTRPLALYQPPPRLTARLAFAEPALEPAEWQGALECLVKDLAAGLGERRAYTITVAMETRSGWRQQRTFLRQATSSPRTLQAAAERLLFKMLGLPAPSECMGPPEPVPGAQGADASGGEPEALLALRIRLGGFVWQRPRQISLFETGSQQAQAELAETLRSLEARYPGLVKRARVLAPETYLPEEGFVWEMLDQEDLQQKKRGRATAKGNAKGSTTNDARSSVKNAEKSVPVGTSMGSPPGKTKTTRRKEKLP